MKDYWQAFLAWTREKDTVFRTVLGALVLFAFIALIANCEKAEASLQHRRIL